MGFQKAVGKGYEDSSDFNFAEKLKDFLQQRNKKPSGGCSDMFKKVRKDVIKPLLKSAKAELESVGLSPELRKLEGDPYEDGKVGDKLFYHKLGGKLENGNEAYFTIYYEPSDSKIYLSYRFSSLIGNEPDEITPDKLNSTYLEKELFKAIQDEFELAPYFYNY